MADFLISARITTPDGLLAQATKIAALSDPIAAFGKVLNEALGVPVSVEIRPIRRGRNATPTPDKPKREKKPKALAIPPAPKPNGDLLGSDGSPGNVRGDRF